MLCPYCQTEISDKAVKCPNCREWINEAVKQESALKEDALRAQVEKKRKNAEESKKASGCCVLFVVIPILVGLVAYATSTESTPTPSTPTPTTTSTPASTYEVVSNTGSGTLRKLIIYTTETSDAKIIALNDLLVGQYTAGTTNLYIDYFDNKSIAQSYFEKILDPKLSESAKNELYSHYLASMKFNTTTGYKELVRQGNPQKTLKTY